MFHGQMHFGSPSSVDAAWRAVPTVVAYLEEQSSRLFVVSGLVGYAVLLIRHRWVGLMLGLLAVVNVYFLENYVPDLYHYLLLTWLILALGVAVLGEWLVARIERHVGPRLRGVEVALILLPLAIVVQQWPARDQSANRAGEQLAADVFEQLPPNAILLTYWDTLTTLSYKHCIEGERPDVALRAYDTRARVTCEYVPDPLEDQVRNGRPVFALFALNSELTPLFHRFDLIPGPTLRVPYGQRELEYAATLYRLELKPSPEPLAPFLERLRGVWDCAPMDAGPTQRLAVRCETVGANFVFFYLYVDDSAMQDDFDSRLPILGLSGLQRVSAVWANCSTAAGATRTTRWGAIYFAGWTQTEPVKPGETRGVDQLCAGGSFGWLIQAGPGSRGGSGRLFTKRSGWAA